MKTCIIVALLVLFAIPVEALTYKWVDNEGTHYTDDLGNIPAKYRKQGHDFRCGRGCNPC